MKELVRTVAYLFTYVASLVTRPRGVTVIAYHAVEPSEQPFGVSPADFAKQLAFLSRHRIVVPLEAVVLYAKGEIDLPRGSVAITFDDGYADTRTTVLPLLKTYGLPATLFLTTDLSPQADLGNLPRPSWSDILDMYESGLVSLQVHGDTHVHLPDIADDHATFRRELVACRDAITARVGSPPRFVAYPYGESNDDVARKTQALGFEAAFTTEEGLVRKGDPLFALRRVAIYRSTSLPLFVLRTTGAVEPYRWLISRLRRPGRDERRTGRKEGVAFPPSSGNEQAGPAPS